MHIRSIFNKNSGVRILLYIIMFWLLQAFLMGGGKDIDWFMIKGVGLVMLQIILVALNLKILIPRFLERKRYLVYTILSILSIYIIYHIFFLVRDVAFFIYVYPDQNLEFLFYIELEAWRFIAGSYMFSIVFIVSTVFKLLVNSREKEKEIIPDVINIKSGRYEEVVNLSEVLYVKGMQEYVQWNLPDKAILQLASLKGIEQAYKSQNFLRVHKSYVVNILNIDKISTNHLIINNQKIPIGRTYKDAVMHRLTS